MPELEGWGATCLSGRWVFSEEILLLQCLPSYSILHQEFLLGTLSHQQPLLLLYHLNFLPQFLPTLDSEFLPVLVLWFCLQHLSLLSGLWSYFSLSLFLVAPNPSTTRTRTLFCSLLHPQNHGHCLDQDWHSANRVNPHPHTSLSFLCLLSSSTLFLNHRAAPQTLIYTFVWLSHSLTDIFFTNSPEPFSAHKILCTFHHLTLTTIPKEGV